MGTELPAEKEKALDIKGFHLKSIPDNTYDYPQGDSNPLPVQPKGKQAKVVTATRSEPLAYSLACETPIDPDLARLLAAWPLLSPPIKAAIRAMLDSVEG